MRPNFTPWARAGMTPEDMQRIRDAEPRDGHATGIADKHNRRVTVRLHDRTWTLLAEAEGRNGAEATELALSKVAA